MSVEALLTVVALAIAVYTILPNERRLDLSLRLGAASVLTVVVGAILVHWITFQTVLENIGVVPDLGQWRWGFAPDTASYVILLVAASVVGFLARHAVLTRSKLRTFKSLSEQLILKRKYSELFFLLETHVDRLSEFVSQDRNAAQQHRGMAESILRRVLGMESVVRELARSNPNLGIRLAQVETLGRWDFVDLFCDSLLRDTSSLLYFEVRNNTNRARGNRYALPSENRLLKYFVGNANRAHELRIYGAFGDSAIRKLQGLRMTEVDRYNFPLDDYDERDKWTCPLHATLRVFDIMVLEALHQRMEWHMWLYYFRIFSKLIIQNLEPHDEVELDSEWPTPYHYLLYDMVSSMVDWIRESEHLPLDQPNIALRTTELDVENENIPKSAIIAIGQLFGTVLPSERVTPRFKGYLLKIVLCLCRDWKDGDRRDYAVLLLKSIAAGGLRGASSSEYEAGLVAGLTKVDWLLRHHLENVESPLLPVLEKARERSR